MEQFGVEPLAMEGVIDHHDPPTPFTSKTAGWK
jgi:hypothetical protein